MANLNEHHLMKQISLFYAKELKQTFHGDFNEEENAD